MNSTLKFFPGKSKLFVEILIGQFKKIILYLCIKSNIFWGVLDKVDSRYYLACCVNGAVVGLLANIQNCQKREVLPARQLKTRW